MFKIENDRLVKDWPATVVIATDGGKTESHDITLDLQLLDVEQSDRVLRYFKKDVKKVIKGWDGIADVENKPFPFSEENLTHAMNNPAFVRAVVEAYLKANSGQAAEKNS